MSVSLAVQHDRRELILRVTSTTIVLPTLAVALRLWSRAVSARDRFWWDDATCILALLFNTAISALGMAWVLCGFEAPASALQPERAKFSLQMLTGTYFIFGLSIGVHKTSALFFYQRIFESQENKRLMQAIYLGHTLVGLWYLYAILQDSLSCIPLSKEWDPAETGGHCTSYYPVYLVTGIFDCLLDLYILLLPLPVIWQSRMPPGKKILIASAMTLGYCCLITSLGRLITTMNAAKDPNQSMALKWNTGTVAIWTAFEPALGVISVCTPSWWPLLVRIHNHGFRSLFYSHSPVAFWPRSPACMVQDGEQAAEKNNIVLAAGMPSGGRRRRSSGTYALPSSQFITLRSWLASVVSGTRAGSNGANTEFADPDGNGRGRETCDFWGFGAAAAEDSDLLQGARARRVGAADCSAEKSAEATVLCAEPKGQGVATNRQEFEREMEVRRPREAAVVGSRLFRADKGGWQ